MIYIVAYSKKCLDFLKMLLLYTDNSSVTLFTHLQHLLNLEPFFFSFFYLIFIQKLLYFYLYHRKLGM